MEVAQNYRLDLQKPQVLYILGGPGSGKGTQCERLVRDFKFEHISVGDVMRAEIDGNTKEGQRIKGFVEKGQIVPTEITVGLLLKAIRSRKAKRFLVDGFPRGVEQALYLEQAFREIEYIVNFDVPEGVLFDRLSLRALTSGRKDDNPETIRNRINVFYESTAPVVEMYSKLGKVGNVSGLGEIEDIYQRVRQVILPNLIFFYGAPSTGKSEVAKRIAQHTGHRYLHLQDFYQFNGCTTNVEKLNKLLKFFQETADRNFIIDAFLDQKAESVVFFEHFGKPRLVVYFQSSKDEIEQNIRLYSQSDVEKKARFAALQVFLQNRDELLAYFAKFGFFTTINAVDTIENLTARVLDLIRPKVFVANTYNNQDLADGYLERLQREEGFVHLHLEQLLEDEVARGTSLGKQISAFTGSGQVVPPKFQSELLRRILFQTPTNTRFVLTYFPEKKQEFEMFERLLFPIDGYIAFMKPEQTIQYAAKINPVLHYIAENKLLVINNDDLGVFRAFLNKRTKYGIVVGPSTSGKTTLARYVAQRHGYTLIEWEPTIALLKEKLGPPGEPLEEVSLARIVEYYKKLFSPVLSEKFIFDGFPPGCDTKAQIEQFLGIGQPSWVLANVISKDNLWKRFKAKNEMDAAAELTPEDDEKMALFLQVADTQTAILNDYVANLADSKLYQLDVQNSLEFTQKALDYVYQKRIFIARSLLQKVSAEEAEALRIVYINIAAQQSLSTFIPARKNMTFVDVESVIKTYQSTVQSEFDMRWTDLPSQFPSNYQPLSVIKLIQQYLQNLPTENRDILLWGYPSADHRLNQKPDETLFPRVTDEIVSLEKALGPIRIVNVIKEEYLDPTIEDPQWELPKIEEKPKKQSDDPDQDPPADAPGDDDDKKPKFNIYEHSWTKSDGVPKNIAQIYTQLKQPQSDRLEVSEYSFKTIFNYFVEALDKVNEDVAANFFVQVQIIGAAN